MKLDKMPYIIYTDVESLIKKIDEYESNPENSSTTKIAKEQYYICGKRIQKNAKDKNY